MNEQIVLRLAKLMEIDDCYNVTGMACELRLQDIHDISELDDETFTDLMEAYANKELLAVAQAARARDKEAGVMVTVNKRNYLVGAVFLSEMQMAQTARATRRDGHVLQFHGVLKRVKERYNVDADTARLIYRAAVRKAASR
ncbi:hypothetical protein ACFWNC_14485 [Streptomyces sp. NPDC058369]|uniref:hypothetical protein n=1 Tax=Streptomyces sp. NPDC058369 TaxID=3346462 RepID=UPI0036477765